MAANLWMLAALLISATALAAPTDGVEQEIRRLERREVEAVLRSDYAAIDALWAPDLTVNSPQNDVTKSTRARVKAGLLEYTSFVREIEAIEIRGDTVFVMGSETVVPGAPRPDAGRTIRRRFTNIWMKSGGGWRLAARHANVIADGARSP